MSPRIPAREPYQASAMESGGKPPHFKADVWPLNPGSWNRVLNSLLIAHRSLLFAPYDFATRIQLCCSLAPVDCLLRGW